MTRINVGVEPRELPSKLLLTEHREITRIPNAIRSGRARMQNIPKHFCLGTGHVKFFYNKLGYLRKRYVELYKECVRRDFDVTSKIAAFEGLPLTDWEPEGFERQLIIDRLNEKGFELK